jgi:hypothetical protein
VIYRGAIVKDQPSPISAQEMEARLQRIMAISVDLGFVGGMEYRHVYSRSGGAQYGIGPSADDDIMVLYAEAFERDADPEDYNLDALIAHECGHQKLHRDPKMKAVFARFPGPALEEVLASLIGSLLLYKGESANTLLMKAIAELSGMGLPDDDAVHFAEQMQRILEDLL